jgi:GAF domain
VPNWSRIVEGARAASRVIAREVRGSTAEEAERRRAHAVALLIVAAVAAMKHVIGVTPSSVPFTLYGAAVVASAAYGGFASGVVASLAAVLAVNIDANPRVETMGIILFTIEGSAVAAFIGAARSHIRRMDQELAAVHESLLELKDRFRRDYESDAASREASHRAWCAYRDQATEAQAALQQAVEEARRQLAAIEALTDPSLDPHAGPAGVREVLERLRTTIGADGVAHVDTGDLPARLLAAVGLQPQRSSLGPVDSSALIAGRVALIHNDPTRIEQVSGVKWPRSVQSLMIVPVIHKGRVWSAVEIATEHPKPATDLDVALARIVADRLASTGLPEPAPLTDLFDVRNPPRAASWPGAGPS